MNTIEFSHLKRILDCVESIVKEQSNNHQQIMLAIGKLEKKVNASMNTIDTIVTAVAAETTLEQSVITLLTNVESQLAAATANGGVTPEVQAKIDAVMANLSSNSSALSAAIAANTPASPVTPAPAVVPPATA